MQCGDFCPANSNAAWVGLASSQGLYIIIIALALTISAVYLRHRAILKRSNKPKLSISIESINNLLHRKQGGATSPSALSNDGNTPPATPENGFANGLRALYEDSVIAVSSIANSIIATSPKDDLPDGDHTVEFPDGTSYSGQFKDGKMNGRGVLLWPPGDRYEGEWRDGTQNGQGTFAAADGSMYFGGWANGQMDGQGVFKPAPPASIVYLRVYDKGQLIKETSLRVDNTKDDKRKRQYKDAKKKAAAAAPTRPLQPGEVIYKGHHSYDLMQQLQVGIMYSIAQAGQESLKNLDSPPAPFSASQNKRKIDSEPLLSSDFSAVAIQYFPGGSAGEAPAFTWKDYAPRAFQRLRSLFGIDNADYLVSLTGGPALRELASPGASGCIFFLSSDDRFMIKSVRKEEMELLLGLIKRYHAHVAAQPKTFLVRFLGVHRISPWLGRNARFLVMGNVLPTDRRMHRKYDLKGSTYKRTVGEEKRKTKPEATLKDLDIDLKFELTAEQHVAFMQQLTADAEFLERLHVIDYSLLLGVHFIRWGNEEWYPPFSDWPSENNSRVADGDDENNRGGENIDENMGVLGGSPGLNTSDSEQHLENHQNHHHHQQQQLQELPNFPPTNRKPKRSGSMAVGESLVDTLESLSSAGVLEPALSRAAASVVATANSSRLAARVLAAEASARSPSRLKQPWMEEKHPVPDFNTVSSMAMISTPASPMALHHAASINGSFGAGGGSFNDRGGGGGGGTTNINGGVDTSILASPALNFAAVTTNNNSNSSSHRKKPSSLVGGDEQRGNGWAVPATAVRITSSGVVVREPVLLYFGIIDFLQKYNARKRVEHAWKSSLHGSSVSVTDPRQYSRRFLKFLGEKFVVASGNA
jgi:1-phosphatidylinositol-4-phosphate 5-kinase